MNHIYVAVFPWVGMVSTKCLDVTDGSLKVVQRLLANSFFFGWALTPVLPTVVLVLFNHVTTLALAQLGIQNNYSKQPFLERSLRELPRAQSRTARRTESRGHLNSLGEADPVLPDRQNPLSQALRAQVFILLRGAGQSLVVDCACVSHELLKHMERHSWSYWQWVPILSISRIPHQHCRWFGRNGTGRPRRLESPWHIYVGKWKRVRRLFRFGPEQLHLA